MKIHAIVQARMGSKRLPGKVMLPLDGMPAIGQLVDRLRGTRVDRVIVAGPMVDQHSPLHEYLKSREIDHFFGEEENDLCARYWSTLALFPCDAFLRICGDSPFIRQEVVSTFADMLRAGDEFVSNVGWKVIPPGNSVEGCTVKFYRNLIDTCEAQDREHAGFPSIYRKIAAQSTLLDTPEDYKRLCGQQS